MGQPTTVTLPRMIQAAEREVTMRRKAYPHMVAKKRMTAEEAAEEINAMQGIVEVLRVMQSAGVP